MADYMVGRKGSGNKDRYMVGWNASAANKSAYKVGNDSKGPAQSSKSVGSDQDSVVGSKSAFSYKENDAKDIGDKSANMNFGGSIKSGVRVKNDIVTSEKGDWDIQTDAMARRKANMEAYGKSAELESPVPQVLKK